MIHLEIYLKDTDDLAIEMVDESSGDRDSIMRHVSHVPGLFNRYFRLNSDFVGFRDYLVDCGYCALFGVYDFEDHKNYVRIIGRFVDYSVKKRKKSKSKCQDKLFE